METKHVFSIFIAVIMVGSIVGFTAFYSFPDQDSGSGDSPPVSAKPTAIDFVAEGVEARVFQLLPSIKIQAETEETDIMAVNTSVYGIDGVRNVSGVFEQWPYTSLGNGYVYVATISFDNSLSYEDVLESLEADTSLESVTGYSFALLELPNTVTMRSADDALDLARDYTFTENIAEGMVEFGSLEGDDVKVSVTATFVGENATNIMAFEEENLTAEPVQKTVSLQAQVASLDKRLEFQASLPYSMADSLQSLKEEILSLSGIVDANVYLFPPEPVLSVESDEILSEASYSGFEAFLNDLNAEDFSLQAEPLAATVTFTDGISSTEFSQKKELITRELEGLSAQATVKEREGGISGEVSLETAYSESQASSIRSLLASKGLELGALDLLQPGQLHVSEIEDSESGTSYPVDSGLLDAHLLPGHDGSEVVTVEVNFLLVRGVISSAVGFESVPG